MIAYRFLPAHAEGDEVIAELVDGTAMRLLDDPEERLGLARAALGLLADAGMSSLTYSGIAARSGVATATLEHYWGNRVDAVTDALAEVFDAHPVPDTGDLHQDLYNYVREVGGVLSVPRAREILGALISESASDPELGRALRERVGAPRRAEIAKRLAASPDRLKVPIDAAIDQLVGPLYHRALIVEAPIDDALVNAVVDSVVVRGVDEQPPAA